MSAHLIIFVKNPVPGAVKTRLQTRYTPEQAAGIYRAFVRDTLAYAGAVPADRRLLAFDPPDAGPDIRRLAGPGWECFPQEGTDLGGRMHAASARSFGLGARRAVVIGTDIPSLPPGHIRRAFDLLCERELVLGPSTDGGYYLIGLSRPTPALFREVEWSSERVFAQTLEQAAAHNLTLGLVPPWYDIDTPEELDFLLAHAAALERAGRTGVLRHTRAYLSALT